MTFQISCPNASCQASLQVSEDSVGKQIQCPQCETICVIRSPGSRSTEALPAASQTLPVDSSNVDLAPTIASDDGTLDDQRTSSSFDLLLKVRGHSLVTIGQEGELARGGMGAVIRGADQILHRPVAMKVMHESAATSRPDRLRFLEEAQITGQLEHPNIVPVHELGEDVDGKLYFTMKLVQGNSLGQILRKMRDGEEAHSPGELLTAFLKVCDAIAFAHSRNVIHRDLKPDNIMLGEFGEVLVMDWGLARISNASPFDFLNAGGSPESARPILTAAASTPHPQGSSDSKSPHHSGEVRSVRSDSDAATLAGTVMGTPAYMPPEQARGDVEALDQRSDIYSLGALLYAMLTLKAPVTGRNVTEVISKVTQGQVTAPEQRAPERHIPPELAAVAMKAMRHVPAERYQTVPELALEIRRFMEGRDVSARKDSVVEATRKLIRRNPRVFLTAASAAILLFVVTSLLLFSLKGERDVARKELIAANKARAAASKARKEQRQTAMTAAEQLARQALRAEDQGRKSEADLRADAALTLMKDGPWGHYALATISHRRGDFAAARNHLGRALKIQSTHGPSRTLQARLMADSGNMERASELLKTIDTSDDWRGLLDATSAFLSTRQYAKAMRTGERAVAVMSRSQVITSSAKDKATRLLEHAQAELACEGFTESIRNLPLDEKLQRARNKLTELHGPSVRRTLLRRGEQVVFTCDGSFESAKPLRFLQPLRGIPITDFAASHTQLRDLTPLTGMPVTTLSLSNCPIEGLTPLRGMPITRLTLRACSIDDLTSLEGMQLAHITLDVNRQVDDISILSGMPLQVVHLSETNVEDLSPLKNSQIRELVISYCPIKDLTPLTSLPLEKLAIDRCHGIRSIAPLSNLKLTHLEAVGINVPDLSALRNLPLESLLLNESKIEDISALANARLKHLDLSHCELLSDFSAVRTMSKLESFKAKESRLNNLDVLNLEALTHLNIDNTTVSVLKPLEKSKLTRLDCAECPITSLESLAGLPIAHLDVDGCIECADFSGLSQMRRLVYFDASHTKLEDLSLLRSGVLTTVRISGTEVSDLSPLRGLALMHFSCGQTKVRDLTPLRNMNLTLLEVPPEAQLTPESIELVGELKKKGCTVVFK